MTALCFLDTETTSLERPSSPTPGEVWEVGLIVRGENDLGLYETEHHWLLPVTLEHADPVSLDIGRFHDRHPQGDRYLGPSGHLTNVDVFAHELAAVIPRGAHLVGNVVSFDEERLAAILHRHGIARPPWHYHLVDVEALAAGALSTDPTLLDVARPPWKSDALNMALGVEEPDDLERHTALGDARWAMATYDAVMGKSRN